MAEKRVFPRRSRRLLVEFSLEGTVTTGFTCDISHTGMFVATAHVPSAGRTVEVHLSLPGGKKVAVSGRVVRARRTGSSLAQTDPGGFCLEISGYFEDYFRYLASLEPGDAATAAPPLRAGPEGSGPYR